MNKLETDTCRLCQGILRHPMLMVIPGASNGLSGDSPQNHKLLIAAQMKCTCQRGIRAEHERNGADLSYMADRVRLAIFEGIERNRGVIPVIDPDRINQSDDLTFVVDFDKRIFKNWLALDLLSVEMFDKYVKENIITVEKVSLSE